MINRDCKVFFLKQRLKNINRARVREKIEFFKIKRKDKKFYFSLFFLLYKKKTRITVISFCNDNKK